MKQWYIHRCPCSFSTAPARKPICPVLTQHADLKIPISNCTWQASKHTEDSFVLTDIPQTHVRISQVPGPDSFNLFKNKLMDNEYVKELYVLTDALRKYEYAARRLDQDGREGKLSEESRRSWPPWMLRTFIHAPVISLY